MAVALQQHKVLVLNKNWRPIRFDPMKRALSLLFNTYSNGQPKARIMDPHQDFAVFTWADWAKLRPIEGNDVIQAGRCRNTGLDQIFRMPEIILLSSKYDKLPNRGTNFSRRTIYRRDNFTCLYCGIRPGSEELTIDHIVPRALDGKTTWENCALACVQCNSQKADYLPENAIRENLTKDKRHLWRGPSPMIRPVVSKPKSNLLRGDKTIIKPSWSQWLSESYWQTELENDMSGGANTPTVDQTLRKLKR